MILVTGSAGHLGEALMRTLHADGREARGVDIRPSPLTDCVGSICDRDLVARCLRGVRGVLHAATLHKPHLATHGARDYVVTKVAAEGLCELSFRRDGLPVVVLRTSRFFPEPDDDAAIRARYELGNSQANEMLHRRVDLEDVVTAHLLALERAPAIGFARYIVSASTPFTRNDLADLRRDAPAVVHRLFPDCPALYAARQWSLFSHIDRVYVNERARVVLDWKPRYDFPHVLECLRTGEDFRSPLARQVGSKGYHTTRFKEGPYPVA